MVCSLRVHVRFNSRFPEHQPQHPIHNHVLNNVCLFSMYLIVASETNVTQCSSDLTVESVHLNHMMEIYSHHNYSLLKASMVVGNLVAPLIAHAFCNYMGLPVLLIPRKGLVSVAFVAGMLSFAWLLLPSTRPDL
ncbi:hypothetical protein Goarm_000008 [Gossypium armourianum]|uniref:Uncharacterized protein n=1 Tax=Gossypium armourianum TaxID=34283 RepID=A0A7J9KE73_9ROSI|nr:hypothetical protein [Gossypium armourianum]